MFRQMKVDVAGVVENMSYFVCPHCNHEIDIFSRGGAENMAKQFGVPSWAISASIPRFASQGTAVSPLYSKARTPRTRNLFTNLRAR